MAKKDVRINIDQSFMVEALRAGYSASAAGRLVGVDRRDTLYGRTRALRKAGVLSGGRQGVADSVRPLVEPRDYLVTVSGFDVAVKRRVGTGKTMFELFGIDNSWFVSEEMLPWGAVTADMRAMAMATLEDIDLHGQLFDAIDDSPWHSLPEVRRTVLVLRNKPIADVDELLPAVDHDPSLEIGFAQHASTRHYTELVRCRFESIWLVWERFVRRLCQRILGAIPSGFELKDQRCYWVGGVRVAWTDLAVVNWILSKIKR